MKGKIPNFELRGLDMITYDLNYFIRKIRTVRNDMTMPLEEGIKELSNYNDEIDKLADRLDEWTHSLIEKYSSAIADNSKVPNAADEGGKQ